MLRRRSFMKCDARGGRTLPPASKRILVAATQINRYGLSLFFLKEEFWVLESNTSEMHFAAVYVST